MSKLGARLGDEIERLGGVAAVATQLRIVRNTIYNWIQKENIPINKLLELGLLGADTTYILTGKRGDFGKLQPREEALLDNYRNSDEKNKKVIEQVALIAAKPQKLDEDSENKKAS